MVIKPDKHQSYKQRCQDLGWKIHGVRNLLLSVHVLCMNYVTKSFRLDSSLVGSYCCVLCKVKAKKENNNIQQGP